MNPSLTIVAIAMLSVLVPVQVIQAQVLSTAENGGRGSHSAMISVNAIEPKASARLSNFWMQYGRAICDRIDAFVGYGNITVAGRSQSYASIWV
jgi:hypothetical protein